MSDFNSFIEEMKTEALNFAQTEKAKLISFGENVAKELTPVVETETLTLFSQLKVLAVNVVGMLAQQEFNNLTGTQKQTIAIGTVVQGAIAQGKVLAAGDAVQLIQAGVNALADAKAK